jgi:lipopolysaccharide export system protein LptA
MRRVRVWGSMRHWIAATVFSAGFVGLIFNADAQSVVGGFSQNYSSNANKPINITSEVLEVDDKKKVAVFKGRVSATQGDFNMKTQELTVNYTTADGKKATPPAGEGEVAATKGAGPLPGGGSGEITEIHAKGDVIITTKDAQEARSDTAVFDVKTQFVTLLGNVRLSKGTDNVIKSGKVVINLTTGITTIADTERISATFTPQSRDKETAKGKSGTD